MGKTSKPLTIQVAQELLESHKELLSRLLEQGFNIATLPTEPVVDIILAPNAMRMTSDMLTQMPAALDLAIKGARTLRYGPTGVLTKKKGVKNVQNKTTRSRKNSAIKTEITDGAQQTIGITSAGFDGGNQTTIITVSRITDSSTTNKGTTSFTEHE